MQNGFQVLKMWRVFALFVGMSVAIGFGASRITHANELMGSIRPQQNVVMSGNDMRALALAYDDWLRNVAGGRYSISDQTIILNHSSQNIFIRFLPKGMGDMLGGGNKFGRETHYKLNSSGTHIVRREFMQ